MIILNMRATFGALEQAELQLHEGLNLLSSPNESGKSTWCAFLIAMFYGIDRTERASKNNLPAKIRYQCWSGSPMEGAMDLVWNGRAITIERRSTARAPMGIFRAYDTHSGQAIPELTGENCGLQLLGVERSVFERSAFIHQSNLCVTQEAALHQRLSSLVSTGEEQYAYPVLEKQLRDLKNRCRHNKTGRIPALEQQLSALQAGEQTIEACQQQLSTLEAQAKTVSQENNAIRADLQQLEARKAAEKYEKLTQAQAEAQRLQDMYTQQKAALAGCPTKQELLSLSRELAQAEREQHMLTLDTTLRLHLPVAPEAPAVFYGQTPEEAADMVRQDIAQLQQAQQCKMPMYWLFAFAAIAAGLAIWLYFLLPVAGYVTMAAAAVILIICLAVNLHLRRKFLKNQQIFYAILYKYDAASPKDIGAALQKFCDDQAAYQEKLAAYDAEYRRRQQKADTLSARLQSLFEQVERIAPKLSEEESCAAQLQRAIARWDQLEYAQREADRAAAYAQQLSTVVETPLSPTAGPMRPVLESEQTLRAKLAQGEAALQQLQTSIDTCRGRLEIHKKAAGGHKEIMALQQELTRLYRFQHAVELAMQALQQANETLQTRFAPQLSQLAGEFFAKLTGGHYEKVLLDEQMQLHTRQAGSLTMRTSNVLSTGTVDQLYLALRLAVSQVLLEKDTPLILDDALIFFDDVRLANAMEVLQEEAEHRQILLFTCHNREKELCHNNR